MAYDFMNVSPDTGQWTVQPSAQGVKKSVLALFGKIAWELLCAFRDFGNYLKYEAAEPADFAGLKVKSRNRTADGSGTESGTGTGTHYCVTQPLSRAARTLHFRQGSNYVWPGSLNHSFRAI